MNTINIKIKPEKQIGPIQISSESKLQIIVHRPEFHILEMTGICFHEDREILLPDVDPLPAEEPGPERVPGLLVMAEVFRFVDKNPDKQIFIAGHTDTVGSDKDNRTLSEDRARNVYLFLSGDENAWANHCQKHFTVEDIKRILTWVATAHPEFNCHPGEINNHMDKETKEARKRFREQFSEQFATPMPTANKQMIDDWLAYFKLYDRSIASLLGDDPDLLHRRSALKFIEPAFLGFGEEFPNERPDLDKFDSERNRRVEILFFDQDEASQLTDKNSIAAAIYGPKRFMVRHDLAVGFNAAPDEIAFHLRDQAGNPVGGLEFAFQSPDGVVNMGTLRQDGFVSFKGISRGSCKFRLFGVEATDWEAVEIGERLLPEPPEEIDTEQDPDAGDPLDEDPLGVFDDDP